MMSMNFTFVERIVVEEGFLDGLDLTFTPGLNVLIGPRGVGKTSVILLLRYCLGASAFSDFSQENSDRHARAILGSDGRVSVALRVGGETYTVSRRASDDEPEGDGAELLPPIVLAQNEIEELGFSPQGRLRLIDGFRADLLHKADRERAALSDVRSQTIALWDLRRDFEVRVEEAAALEQARQVLRDAESEATQTEENAQEASDELHQLDRLGREIATAQTGLAILARSEDALDSWLSEISAARRAVPTLESLASEEVLEEVREDLGQVLRLLDEAASRVAGDLEKVRGLTVERRAEVTEQEDSARDLRRFVETVTEGAGAASRRVSASRERVAQLEALADLVKEQEERVSQVVEARSLALEFLEDLRVARHLERVQVAEWLNSTLRPPVQVAVRSSGLWDDYANAIAVSLKGSGLHYSDIAQKMAEGMSPRQLAQAIEEDAAGAISKCAEIPEDRARRVVDRLREVGIADVLTSELDDYVEVSLLDGDRYKPSENLSTGQRCTAVLPVVLRHEERPVVLDQPEDHLDGAFIVDTLVKGITSRQSGSQLIVATHNPNIPVLGNAAVVTLLGSDGHRGFKRHSGELFDPSVVSAITSLMEGGQEAFDRRATFYGDARS
jgi:predicted ATPase